AVLPDLATLSRVFQRGTINYILPAITYTTDNLTKIAQDETPITQLQVDVKESGRLSTCEFQSNKHKKQVLRNLLMNYTQVLKENIDSRFQDAMPVVYAFSIFNANALPNRGTAEFTTYGSKEIGTLSIHYFPAWTERGASAVKRVKSRLRSSMTNQMLTNQMLEALLHVFINGPPVSEAQKLKRRKLLPPANPANPGVTSSGKLQSEVQANLVDSAVQTDIQVQEEQEEEVEEASVQAEVEAAVEAFKLADDQPN
ncbi:hypothetical protein P5673_005680, partial [Acropora cervicornis]